MTLRNLLTRRVRDLDRKQAAILIRAGGVYVNRLRVRLPQILVAPGERITVYLEALDAVPVDPQSLNFVHRSPEFVVVDKPAGVPVAPVRETAVGCLSEALIHRLESEGVTRPYVGVVHRLDQGASGLVLFTIRDIANKSLHKQFVEHRIRRRYRVRVQAEPRRTLEGEIRCDAPLIKRKSDKGGGVVVGKAGEAGAMEAHSRFVHVAALEGGQHLFDVEIETGRTHQIRAHAAHLGFPVVGDRRYGGDPVSDAAGAAGDGEDEDEQVEALCLHAWQLDFEHPVSEESVHLEAGLPDWARG